LMGHGVFGCLVLARRAAQELPVCVSHRIWKHTPRPSGLKPNSLTHRSCRQRSGIHGKQEKQGTTEHTETTEAGHNRREDRFRVFGVFCG
jgi:hypothetical protein